MSQYTDLTREKVPSHSHDMENTRYFKKDLFFKKKQTLQQKLKQSAYWKQAYVQTSSFVSEKALRTE